MKKVLFVVLSVMLATLPAMAGDVINPGGGQEYLFVLSSGSGSIEGNTLTLNKVNSVVYFSDRPNRIAGHISLQQFVDNWGKGVEGFDVDPPNATLSIFDDDKASNVVIELLSSKITDGAIQFNIKVLKGEMPSSFGVSSLFIDPINQNGQWTGT
jgi:hypothetical protein